MISKPELAAAVLANVLILGTLAFAAGLHETSSDLYYASVQEDEILEWATFWAFIATAGVSLVAALRQRRATGELPWFLAGVAVFCFLFAMEEISWGQRVFGYRPPTYFLQENFQQELNFHNVLSTQLRQLTLKAIILGYGVALPLSALLPAVRRGLERAAIVAPAPTLAPGFLAAYWAYESYPWTHTGEWVEMMLGLGFLFSVLLIARRFRSGEPSSSFLARPPVAVAVSCLAVLGLGVASAAYSRGVRAARPEVLAAARTELEALRRDFASGEVRVRCNVHKRIYSFVEKYDQDYLYGGEYSRLVDRGLPEERAGFFLDPWNSPYWIRRRCEGDRRIQFVYSFGPNRRRESDRWEILGDDIGAIISEKD
jgi:hypothetical protein